MSSVSIDFTISQINTDFVVSPAPIANLSILNPITTNFFVEGTTGGPGGVVNSIQINNGDNTLTGTANFTFSSNNSTLTLGNSFVFKGNIGTIEVNGSAGNAGQVLTSQGNSAALIWTTPTTGTVTNVSTSGSGLGFSISGGPITNTGTITLTIPTDTALRTSLNIGNIANLNLNGNGSQLLAGNGTFVSDDNIKNLKYAYEAINIHSTTSGTFNYDTLNSTVSYSNANATANITINFRGNSTTTLDSQLTVGQSVTCVYLMTTGATGYIPTVAQVDGSTQTIRYAGNVGPTVIANTICSYTYTIMKTGTGPTTWLVFGSQTRYG